MKNGFYLEIVSYRDSLVRTVRLMHQDGAGHSCWLSGMMYRKEVEKLVEESKLNTVRVQSKLYMGKEKENKVKKTMGKKTTKLKPVDLQHHGLFAAGERNG